MTRKAKKTTQQQWPTYAPGETITFKPGTYVTDTSASGRYYTAVYCVTGQSFDRTIVRYVGEVKNGRLEYSREQPVTHRMTKNLREYRGA